MQVGTAAFQNEVNGVRFTRNRLIIQELESIQGKQAGGATGRRHNATEDSVHVLQCYRRIQGHLKRLSASYTLSQDKRPILTIPQLNSDMSKWKIADEERMVSALSGPKSCAGDTLGRTSFWIDCICRRLATTRQRRQCLSAEHARQARALRPSPRCMVGCTRDRRDRSFG